MFDFINTTWFQLAFSLYILVVPVSLIYGFVLSEYWFIVRILVALSFAGVTLWAGEYMRMHEAVPYVLQIFPLSYILPDNVFTMLALYGITFLLLLSVLSSASRVLSRAWKEKDTTLTQEHSFQISPHAGHVSGIEFVFVEGKSPLFRVYYKRNGVSSEWALRLDIDKGVFMRDDEWSDEEWKAIEKVAPLVTKEISATIAEIQKISILP